jgi:hypothetical protein
MGKVRYAYKILVGSSAGKIPFGIYRQRQVDNIKK